MNENKTILEEELSENLARAYGSMRSAMNALHRIANAIELNLKQSSTSLRAKQEPKTDQENT
jgi:DNA polymerase III delta prime subunit